MYLHTGPGCSPRPELKPPHYQSLVGGCVEGVAGGDEAAAAAGESVLRILEVMSRAVLYNTRSAFFRPPPPLSPPLVLAALFQPSYYGRSDEKWK